MLNIRSTLLSGHVAILVAPTCLPAARLCVCVMPPMARAHLVATGGSAVDRMERPRKRENCYRKVPIRSSESDCVDRKAQIFWNARAQDAISLIVLSSLHSGARRKMAQHSGSASDSSSRWWHDGVEVWYIRHVGQGN